MDAFFPLDVLTAWLAADFFSGVFHWVEDRYGVEDWPVVGPLVVAPNVAHHSQPMAFVQQGFVSRNWTTILPAWLAAAAAWLLGSPWFALAFFFTGFGNEVHSWAHQRCSRPIRGLQLIGIIQSQEQHAAHHRRPFDQNYCVMTDWLNPVFTWNGFWLCAEEIVEALTGAVPRPERREA
jgi:ubiquitin-conjugating enzyme E2 variant